MTEPPLIPVISKVRNGSLIFGGTAPDYADGVDFACDAKSMKLTPAASKDGDDIELACGTTIAAPVTETYTLNGTGIQRFNEADRMQAYCTAHAGETVHFRLVFNDEPESPIYSGEVTIVRLEVGGDVGANPGDLSFEFDGVGMWEEERVTAPPLAAPAQAELIPV